MTDEKMLQSLMSSLSPEQLEAVMKFQAIPGEILIQLSFAAITNDVDIFTLTIAGMIAGGKETREYFRTIRAFLNQPEVAESLK